MDTARKSMREDALLALYSVRVGGGGMRAEREETRCIAGAREVRCITGIYDRC